MSTYIQTVPLLTPCGALRLSGSSGEALGAQWRVGRDDQIEFFPRGSCAFAVAARSVAKDPDRPVCFFPSYFCDSSLKLLRQAGARIVFYRVARDLTPNWDDVRQRAKTKHPDLFVLVHTFGHAQDPTEVQVFAKEEGCVVLEDAAHVLKPDGPLGRGGTVVLFSPHKLLALPPISLLTIPHSLAERVWSPYKAAWRTQDWKWFAKRLIQKGIVTFGGLGIKVKPRSGEFNGDTDNDISVIDYPRKISKLGRRLLLAEQQDLGEIARLRRENFAKLACALAEISETEIPQPFETWPEGAAPYAFPFFVGQHRASAVYTALWRLGIPAQTWPDLPPEVSAQPEEYSEALYWRRNLLLLPIHQSLTSRQINMMIYSLKDILARS